MVKNDSKRITALYERLSRDDELVGESSGPHYVKVSTLERLIKLSIKIIKKYYAIYGGEITTCHHFIFINLIIIL